MHFAPKCECWHFVRNVLDYVPALFSLHRTACKSNCSACGYNCFQLNGMHQHTTYVDHMFDQVRPSRPDVKTFLSNRSDRFDVHTACYRPRSNAYIAHYSIMCYVWPVSGGNAGRYCHTTTSMGANRTPSMTDALMWVLNCLSIDRGA